MIESGLINIKCANPDTITIEAELKRIFGEIVRWAVVNAVDDNLKISVTYEKESD